MDSPRRRHPVERLFNLLTDLDYPDGLVAVPDEKIHGTAFFPGGYGLWRETRGGPLPPMPRGKVMVLGNNFDSECGFRRSLLAGDELHTRTWQNLLRLLRCRSVGIRPEDCFFTNAYMGLLAGCSTNEGESPGAKDPVFKQYCESFLAEQIAELRPRLILALGTFVPRFIASISSDLAAWRRCETFRELDKSGPLKRDVHFGTRGRATTVVALVHPSRRGPNVLRRRYRGRIGNEAELALLREALDISREPD